MIDNPPTMRDVAKLAGVSIQTVSAIINGKPGITNETRDRVLESIRQLGYRPFSVARSLRTRQTKTVSLVVSDIANPAFSVLTSAIGDALYSYGYGLIVYSTHNDPEREKACIQAITQRWIDGVLFVSAGDPSAGLAMLSEARIPVVAIDRIPLDYDGMWVTMDNRAAGVLAAEHLLALGHTHIAHIRGPETLLLAREREEGFRGALENRGLGLVCPSTEAKGWGCGAGYQEMKDLLERHLRVSAVFAASDRLAIGAIHAIREAGLAVPQDFSVIGVDDIEVAAYMNPPLTTIRQSFTELAQRSVDLLMARLQRQEMTAQQVFIQPELVARESTIRCPDCDPVPAAPETSAPAL